MLSIYQLKEKPKLLIILLLLLVFCTNKALATDILISNAINSSKYFTGRDIELKQMEKLFKAGGHTVSLSGVAGIGKTQLVRKYIELHQGKYKIIWFFNCKKSLVPQFQDLARQINNLCKESSCKIDEDADSVIDSTRNYIKNHSKWLLIFDNYKNDGSTTDSLRYFNEIALLKDRHIILISRKKEGLRNMVRVGPFERKESVKLLSRIVSKKDNGNHHDLAEMLRDYPLALSKVGFFLNKNNFISFDDLKTMLSGKKEILDQIYQDDDSEYFNGGQTIEKIISHHFSSFDRDTIKLLIFAALLDNENLNKGLLEAIYVNDISNDAYIDVSKKDTNNNAEKKQEFLKALLELHQNSLIEYKPKRHMDNSSEESFEMHDFIQKTIVELDTENLIEVQLRDLIKMISRILPEDIAEIGILQNRYLYLTSNLESLVENAQRFNLSAMEQLHLRKHLLLLYFYNNNYTQINATLNWFDESIHDLNLSNKETKIIACQFYLFKGQYNDIIKTNFAEALKNYEIALFLLKENENKEYNIAYTIHTAMAQTLFDNGHLTEAVEVLSKATLIIKQHPDIPNAGLYYYVKTRILIGVGDLTVALESIEDLMRVEENLPINIFSAPTYFLKAEILSKIGRVQESYKIMKEVFEVLGNIEKENYQMKATFLGDLAATELKLGMTKEAMGHIDLAINNLHQYYTPLIGRDRIKIYNDKLAILYHGKADIEFKKERYAEALVLYQQAIEIFEARYKVIEVDRMSELYTRAAESSLKLKDKFLYKFYLQKQEKHFGTSHHRTKFLYQKMI